MNFIKEENDARFKKAQNKIPFEGKKSNKNKLLFTDAIFL